MASSSSVAVAVAATLTPPDRSSPLSLAQLARLKRDLCSERGSSSDDRHSLRDPTSSLDDDDVSSSSSSSASSHRRRRHHPRRPRQASSRDKLTRLSFGQVLVNPTPPPPEPVAARLVTTPTDDPATTPRHHHPLHRQSPPSTYATAHHTFSSHSTVRPPNVPSTAKGRGRRYVSLPPGLFATPPPPDAPPPPRQTPSLPQPTAAPLTFNLPVVAAVNVDLARPASASDSITAVASTNALPDSATAMSRGTHHTASNDYMPQGTLQPAQPPAGGSHPLTGREVHQTMGPRKGQQVLRQQQALYGPDVGEGEYSDSQDDDDEEDDRESQLDEEDDEYFRDHHQMNPHPQQPSHMDPRMYAGQPSSRGPHSGRGPGINSAARGPADYNIYQEAGIDGPHGVGNSWDDRKLQEPLMSSPVPSNPRRGMGLAGPPSAAAAAAAAAASQANQVYGSGGSTSPGIVVPQAGRGRRPSMSRPAVKSPASSNAGGPPFAGPSQTHQPMQSGSAPSGMAGKQLPVPPGMASPLMYQQQQQALKDREAAMMAATYAAAGASSGAADDPSQVVMRYIRGVPPQHQMGPPDDVQYAHSGDYEEGEKHHEHEDDGEDDNDDLVPTEQDWQGEAQMADHLHQNYDDYEHTPPMANSNHARYQDPPEFTASPREIEQPAPPMAPIAVSSEATGVSVNNPVTRRVRSGTVISSTPPTSNRSRLGLQNAPFLPLAAAATGRGTIGGTNTGPPLVTRKRRTSEGSAGGGLNKDELLKRMAEALATERERASLFQKELTNAEREIDELASSIDDHKRQHAKVVTALKKDVASLKKERETLIRALEEAEGLDDDEADRYLALLDPMHPGVLQGTSEYEVDHDGATPVNEADDGEATTTAATGLANRNSTNRHGPIDVNGNQPSVKAQMQEKSAQRAARISSALQILSPDSKPSTDLLIGSTLVNSVDDGRRNMNQQAFPTTATNTTTQGSEELLNTKSRRVRRDSSRDSSSVAKGVMRRFSSKKRSESRQGRDSGNDSSAGGGGGTLSGFFRRRKSSSISRHFNGTGNDVPVIMGPPVISGPIAVQTTTLTHPNESNVGLGIGSGGRQQTQRGYSASGSGGGRNAFDRHLKDSNVLDRALQVNGNGNRHAGSGMVGNGDHLYDDGEDVLRQRKNNKIGKLFRKVFPSYQDSDPSDVESDIEDSPPLRAGPRY